MGRRKVSLVWIANAAARRATYRKRRAGLMKKAKELATLCDVKACVVVYGEGSTVPETWPDEAGAKEIFERFKAMPELEQFKKRMDQGGFLRQRIEKLQEQVDKVQRETRERETALLLHDVIAGRRGVGDLNVEEVTSLGCMVDARLRRVQDRMVQLHGQGQLVPPLATPSLPPPAAWSLPPATLAPEASSSLPQPALPPAAWSLPPPALPQAAWSLPPPALPPQTLSLPPPTLPQAASSLPPPTLPPPALSLPPPTLPPQASSLPPPTLMMPYEGGNMDANAPAFDDQALNQLDWPLDVATTGGDLGAVVYGGFSGDNGAGTSNAWGDMLQSPFLDADFAWPDPAASFPAM